MKHRTEAYGLGRSRSSEGVGEIVGVHLNPYVNCVHTLVGGWKTMQVLVVEVYEEEAETIRNK